MNHDIATDFRTRRRAKGLSQADVARRSGTQQRQVSLFERGGDITLCTLIKFAQALDIELIPVPREYAANIETLLTGKPEPEISSKAASLLERYQVNDDEAPSHG